MILIGEAIQYFLLPKSRELVVFSSTLNNKPSDSIKYIPNKEIITDKKLVPPIIALVVNSYFSINTYGSLQIKCV